MMSKKILIIIPAFNEEQALPLFIQELKKTSVQADFLVINDGSTDQTATAAERAGAAVITLPLNLGIGGAMQTGFRAAKELNYDIAVQMDGDGQHPAAGLSDIISPVIDGKFDMVIGSRFLQAGKGFKSTFTRRMGIQFFSTLLSTLTKMPITDPTSGFRAVNRKLIDSFSDYYPVDFPEPEAIMIAKRLGAKIGEVHVTMRERLGGISSIRDWKTLYYMIKVTLAILIDLLKKKE